MESDKHKVDLTVLLVDDEKSIYEPLQALLERWGGYKVLVAENGYQALTVYDQYPHNIPLVVTDMMMPQMSGKALIQALYERDQNIKIIGLSGRLQNSSETITTPMMIEWLSKPIDAMVLVQTINKLLA